MKKYAYFVDGRNLIVLEYDESTGKYVTPTSDLSDGILIRHNVVAGSVSTETDEIPVNGILEKAVESYVRMKLAENEGNPGLAMYYERKFYVYRERGQENRLGVPRIAKVGNWGVK